MLILGVDPGTARLGYGIVEATGAAIEAVAYGVLETAPSEPMARRLVELYEGLTRVISEFRPDAVAVEKLFFSRNVTTALTVGQARGVVLLAGAQADLPIAEYTPAEVKQSVSGYGNADKGQMQEMVRVVLNLDHVPRPDDAADALAVALCHSQIGLRQERLTRQPLQP